MSEYLIKNFRKVITPIKVSVGSGKIEKVIIDDAISISVENLNPSDNDSIGYVEFTADRSFALPVVKTGASRTFYSSDSIPFAHKELWVHFADEDGNPASGTMLILIYKLVKITDVPAPQVTLEIENPEQVDDMEIIIDDPNNQHAGDRLEVQRDQEPTEKYYLDN